jgi:hypothetical protein
LDGSEGNGLRSTVGARQGEQVLHQARHVDCFIVRPRIARYSSPSRGR